MPGSVHQMEMRQIPEDSILDTHSCENLKPHADAEKLNAKIV
jgi:hypothetical protein